MDSLDLIYEKPADAGISKLDSLLSAETILVAPVMVDLELAKKMYDLGIMFVDARDKDEYDESHITGAILEPTITGELTKDFPSDKPLITYCSGGHCDLSFELAMELMEEWNYEKVFVYEGGLPEWEEAGYPVHR
ncbi:uncharacterized protein METZ01_LOCUS269695 [marine metagenome]|uniref:Rhodanese domain-containing protein n=1 Tax=marine metagenome TaxID=408172 RepID=A0A382K2C9_9ZZZZ